MIAGFLCYHLTFFIQVAHLLCHGGFAAERLEQQTSVFGGTIFQANAECGELHRDATTLREAVRTSSLRLVLHIPNLLRY